MANRKYHILVVRTYFCDTPKGTWHCEFGSYVRSEVIEEKEACKYSDGIPNRDIKVITLPTDTQQAIDAYVRSLNFPNECTD